MPRKIGRRLPRFCRRSPRHRARSRDASSYIPHWVQGDPCTVLIYEQYQDQKAEEAHRQSPHFKKYAVAGLYQKMLERSREDLAALA